VGLGISTGSWLCSLLRNVLSSDCKVRDSAKLQQENELRTNSLAVGEEHSYLDKF
jgi:hypothetical protein